MLYTTVLVAAAAVFDFALAQNTTLPVQPCCNVSADAIPDDQKTDWCRAERNTCPQICGGQGQVASGGNDCNDDTLTFTCECKNGTSPDMSAYEQSVPGQMCRFWYSLCTNATVGNADQQFLCDTTRNERCGNLTTAEGEASSTASGGATSSPTGTGGSSASSTATGTGASQSTGAAAVLDVAREFGTPVLAGGLIALFGFAL